MSDKNKVDIAVVHETHESGASITLTPGHPPRRETAAFEKTRHFLIEVKQQGCYICGITHDDIQSGDPTRNPLGAKFMEAHHDPVEWSICDAVDPLKVHRDFPQVFDRETLEQFLDSPANMRVCCDIHHVSVERGIHHILYPEWIVQRYLLDGYQIEATAKDAAAVEAKDEQIEVAAGLEQAA
jgi:hypothetical protein